MIEWLLRCFDGNRPMFLPLELPIVLVIKKTPLFNTCLRHPIFSQLLFKIMAFLSLSIRHFLETSGYHYVILIHHQAKWSSLSTSKADFVAGHWKSPIPAPQETALSKLRLTHLHSYLLLHLEKQIEAPFKPAVDVDGTGKNFDKYDEDEKLFRKNSADKYGNEFADF